MANTVLSVLFLSIIEISVSVSLIVAVLMTLTSFINKRYAAKWKYWIWIFLAVRLLVPFSGTVGESASSLLPQLKTQTASRYETSHAETMPQQITSVRRVIVEIPAQMTTPIAVQSEKGNVSITPLDAAAFVWITGGLIFISVHLLGFWHYKRQVVKKGKTINDTRILRQIFELKTELHIKSTIRAIEYPKAASPMIIGFFKPVLVLPEERYGAEDMFFILKHELVHLKRGDVYFKFLFVAANAVHWFNPLIWIMQKEAAVDMELSCDERVTQGTDYAVRKAYTETLLSTLHKRCARGTALSTQFYGGKQIMKKRFKNILVKKGKKNGVCVLLCAIILTVSLGTMIGCSAAKGNTENVPELSEKEPVQSMEDILGLSEKEPAQSGQQADSAPDGNTANTPENTTTLTFYKEGEPEEKPATLMVGDGYSIYLPDGEWQKSIFDGWLNSGDSWILTDDDDTWTAVVNEQVRLWIKHFGQTTVSAVEEELTAGGYVDMAMENVNRWRQEGELIYNVELKEYENDVWGICYCYPVDAEEGWGRELTVIADTFAVSVPADNAQAQNDSRGDSGAFLGAAERQEIRNIVDKFAAAYFAGDADTIQKFLADTYEGNISTYQGTGTASDLTVKGLTDADEHRTGDGTYDVSLEYRDSENADTFRYLTFEFVRQEDDWKIQFYGLEG